MHLVNGCALTLHTLHSIKNAFDSQKTDSQIQMIMSPLERDAYNALKRGSGNVSYTYLAQKQQRMYTILKLIHCLTVFLTLPG